MRIIQITVLTLAMISTVACEVRMAPSDYFSRIFKTQTDTKYYRGKAKSLVENLAENAAEYDINRVAVLDLVDEDGRTPILGEYLSERVIEAITRRKQFRVTQKGEVVEALNQLTLKPSYLYTREDIKSLGKALNSQALLTGKLTDLGTNLDVHLSLIDVMTGEVIASASEHLTRTKFAVEMLRHF
jgi:TolB-like protein